MVADKKDAVKPKKESAKPEWSLLAKNVYISHMNNSTLIKFENKKIGNTKGGNERIASTLGNKYDESTDYYIGLNVYRKLE